MTDPEVMASRSPRFNMGLCETCRTVRPLRSKHCNHCNRCADVEAVWCLPGLSCGCGWQCADWLTKVLLVLPNRCVEGCDHHCPVGLAAGLHGCFGAVLRGHCCRSIGSAAKGR